MTEEKNLRINLAELQVFLDAAYIAAQVPAKIGARFPREIYLRTMQQVINRMGGIPVDVDGGTSDE